MASYAGSFVLLTAEPLLEEYWRVLQRPKLTGKYGLTQDEIATFLSLLTTVALKVAPSRRLPVTVRDAKDEMVLATALGGKADFLVTGDDDLLVLRDDPRLRPLRIVKAKEFLEILGAE